MNNRQLYNRIMESVAKQVKKTLYESAGAVKKDFIDYIKLTLVDYFDCGNPDYAEECFNSLTNNDNEAYDDVIEYLYDHDDDNYINNYMREYDIDFVEDELYDCIQHYYAKAYKEYLKRI